MHSVLFVIQGHPTWAKYTIETVSIVFLLLHGLHNRFMIWKDVAMPKKAQKRTGNAKKA